MMYTLWVLALALGAVAADVGLGYDYKVPHTSYGVPSYQISSSSTQSATLTDRGYVYKQPINKFVDHSNLGQYTSTNVQKVVTPGYYVTGYQQGSTANTLTSQPPSYTNFGTNSANTFVHTVPQYQNNIQYTSAAANKYSQYYIQQQPAEVYRHFYVHSAPEELEPPKPKQAIVLPPPQKHYKIIFVKAPSESRSPQILPVAPQNEEKTIVYVLVKKPEEPEVIVPKVEQKPPTKPEVYFIKYNNKQDSQHVIENIVNDYNKGHAVTNNVYGNDNLHIKQTEGSSGSHLNGALIGIPTSTPSSFAYAVTTQTPPTIFDVRHQPTGTLSTINIPSSSTSGANVNYNVNAISTSQGVPHETYGPPKFRPN